jgi:hypothetical protein
MHFGVESAEAKNFYHLSDAVPQRVHQIPKVFWFFFSKKNRFLTLML